MLKISYFRKLSRASPAVAEEREKERVKEREREETNIYTSLQKRFQTIRMLASEELREDEGEREEEEEEEEEGGDFDEDYNFF